MEPIENTVREYVYSMAHTAPHLISERNIAQHFQLKRNTVREIFLALEGEGILKRMPRVGYKLVDYSDSDTRTVYAIRYAIEREAARKALKNATREDILRMTLILEEMNEILIGEKGDAVSFWKADMDFHQAFVKSSHDNMLIRIFLFITTPLFRPFTPLSKLGPTHLSHQRLLAALKKCDEEALMAAVTSHLGNYQKIKDGK